MNSLPDAHRARKVKGRMPSQDQFLRRKRPQSIALPDVRLRRTPMVSRVLCSVVPHDNSLRTELATPNLRCLPSASRRPMLPRDLSAPSSSSRLKKRLTSQEDQERVRNRLLQSLMLSISTLRRRSKPKTPAPLTSREKSRTLRSSPRSSCPLQRKLGLFPVPSV